MEFKYRKSVLDELARHGIIPRSTTPPTFVHEFVNELYVYEIRRLREQMRGGLIHRDGYANRVEELRNRYPVLSLPVAYWIETK
jgi:hypothetical protein